MQQRIVSVLRRADRGDYALALGPTLLLALPATPYLAWPLIMLIKAPQFLGHTHWLTRSWIILGSLLALAAISLALARWTVAPGRRRAAELLQSTNVLLYAMLHDSDSEAAREHSAGLSVDIFSARPAELGSFELRLLRLAARFDYWCGRVHVRFTPRAVHSGALVLYAMLLAAQAVLPFMYEALYWWAPLALALPLVIIYQHVTSCGLRIGVRQALAEYFSTEMARD